jgi:hypothetical protein
VFRSADEDELEEDWDEEEDVDSNWLVELDDKLDEDWDEEDEDEEEVVNEELEEGWDKEEDEDELEEDWDEEDEVVVEVLVPELKAETAATPAITITITITRAETILEIASSFLRYKLFPLRSILIFKFTFGPNRREESANHKSHRVILLRNSSDLIGDFLINSFSFLSGKSRHCSEDTEKGAVLFLG